ncbi:hypothetical protein [Desulfovibrio gilichinskyi]|uniref:Uncharacterized protein n=1 Tax=Desulfovibrio gilichinskyi TaxID=1519643 RepID=A0A1X7C3W6_9BACT|nr:hypothetical protein [Desulfovibrio gilichinskyi]SME89362.1 hypothetical protein SAMN06295933_0283 [Desulfovibrio gilichinskyi]
MAAKDAFRASCWQIDKKIGLAIILGVFIQFGGVIWWASDLSARLESVENEQARYEHVLEELATIKANVAWIKQALEK